MKKLLIICLALFTAGTVFAQIIDKPVATVNLQKRVVITQKQLRQQITLLEKELGSTVAPENRKQILDVMINGILVSQAAERDGVKVTDFEVNTLINQQVRAPLEQSVGRKITDAEFQKYVSEQGLSWDEFYKDIRDGLVSNRYINFKKKAFFDSLQGPTESEIAELYHANSLKFTNPEIAKFSQIFIDTRRLGADDKERLRKEIDALYKNIQNGRQNFSDVLVEYSSKPKPNYQADIAAYLARNDAANISLLGTPFFETVFSMKSGEIKGVVESKAGFHIIKMTEVLPKKFLSLDDPILPNQTLTVREYIRQQKALEIQQQAIQQATAEVVAELRKSAEIKVYEENLKW